VQGRVAENKSAFRISGQRKQQASFVPREGLCTKTAKDLSNRFSVTACYKW
jgi:hypothetical protein